MNFAEIETKSKNLANARTVLSVQVSNLTAELELVKRSYLGRIKQSVARVAERHAELHAAIASSPELYEKPRTRIFHGIKGGFRKGTGGIDWDDDERTADLIEKHFPDQFEVLVKTTRTPQKKALANLDVHDLKKVGCTVESTGDVVVIKATDSDVDKVVNALLKGATDEAQAEAA